MAEVGRTPDAVREAGDEMAFALMGIVRIGHVVDRHRGPFDACEVRTCRPLWIRLVNQWRSALAEHVVAEAQESNRRRDQRQAGMDMDRNRATEDG